MKNFLNPLALKLLAGWVVLALAACQTVQTTSGGAVGVERQQQMAISSQAIDQAATQEYAQLIASQQQKGLLNRNPVQTQRVRMIAQRLIAQTGAFRPDALRWNWQISVLTSPEVNAWCMPGGKMAVYTGLLEKLAVTDDELAAVIGHEIAHALREHARERASEQQIAGMGISIVSTLAGVGSLGQQGFQYAYMGLLGLPNSRQHEIEADRIGVELAARAGFDPRAATSLWQKMARGGSEPPKFLSTHPPRQQRLQDLDAYSQRVMPLYQQARAARS